MLIAIGAALLGGMILNLMPCVFPVISLKAIGLVRHGGRPAQLRLEGLAFLGGVVVTMLALAGALIAARSAGAAIGWGFQLQSPLVIAVLALVTLGAALNLSGLFEVGLSVQRVGEGMSERGGAVGAALTGVLAIIVATPCTAPFMAGALGYALVQPPLVGLSIFLALAIGFAAPFTILSLVPGLANRLPRPGAWMAVVKKALAFPMFGAAAWLIWVLDRQAGASALAVGLGCSVGLAFAGWIYGMAQQRHMLGQRSGALYTLAAATVALLAASLVALPKPVADQVGAIAADTTSTAFAPVKWSPQAVAALRAQGKPVFVNFTAAWCITCQVNDRAALSTTPVREALQRTGTTYMVADSTNYDAGIEQALAEFGRGGLPLYVLYPAGGGKPVILPQLLSRSIVVDALNAAAKGAHS
jgi:thiol:disulfide interchange protein DsbD